MPMIIESLITILACARIGVPHVVVFGGFSAHELGNRIIDCKPKLLICANAGREPNKTIDYLKIVNEALRYSKREDLSKIIL
jgi:propionyl-CoA synthetase